MARLRSGTSSTPSSNDQPLTTLPSTSTAPSEIRQRQPAVVGKLQEIDLGPSAALKNIALTEAATRRLQGGDLEAQPLHKPPEKIRLGRDGKPRRKRYRRPSDALKRDAIVEAILHESKRTPPVSPLHSTPLHSIPNIPITPRTSHSSN